MKYFLVKIISLSLFLTDIMAEGLSCDSNYVQLQNGEVTLTPSSDDSGNLQCAFDEAASNGYPLVTLSAGDFEFGGEVIVNEFTGKFSGAGMERTVINTNAYRIYLRSSNVEVALMSLTAAPSTNGAFFWIHPVEYDCNKRVTRTRFDRVRMEWIPTDGSSYKPDNTFYIYAGPYWYCRDKPLLGSLSVNRSEFRGADVGNFIFGFGGGAKIDFSNNIFWGGTALWLSGERQSYDNPLNITFSFTGNKVTTVDENNVAIRVGFGDFGVDSSSLHIARNTFRQERLFPSLRGKQVANILDIGKGRKPVLTDEYSVALTIVGNTFDRQDWLINEQTGEPYDPDPIIRVDYLDKGVVSANRFICNYGAIAKMTGDQWAIAGNNFQKCRDESMDSPGYLDIVGDENVEGGNTY